MRLKKRIVRTLIEEIIVDVDSTAGEVIVIIHWKGEVHTELRLPRRRTPSRDPGMHHQGRGPRLRNE
jgi:hypothetical protein